MGPFDVDELLKYSEKHKVDEEYLKKYSNGKNFMHGYLKIQKNLRRKLNLKFQKVHKFG